MKTHTLTPIFCSSLLLILFNGGFSLVASEPAPSALWVREAWGLRVDGYGVVADPNGDILVTGGNSGYGVRGSITLPSNRRFYLAKYDGVGNLIWVQTSGSSGIFTGNGIASDKRGNVYVAGYFEGGATLGTNVLVNNVYYNAFVAKYDSVGSLQWVRTGGGADFDRAEAVAVDGAGNVFVGGSIQGNVTFDGISITNVGAKNFLAKYDPDGNISWIQTAGSRRGSIRIGLALDHTGNLYVGGGFTGSSAFGGTSLVAGGVSDVFLAKYTTDGEVQWVRQAGGGACGCDPGPYGNQALGVVVDAAGNAFVTGGFWANGIFGTTNLTTRGNVDAFLAKYDASGNLLWVRQDGGDGYDYGRSIALDRIGNLYVAGQFSGTATFGNTNVLGGPVGRYQTLDNFLAKYDPAGTPLWVLRLGTNDYTQAPSTAVDSQDNALVLGASRSPVDILGNSITNAGTATMFLAKLDSATRPALTAASSSGGLQLAWPAWATNFMLQSSTSFVEPRTWTAVETTSNSVTVPVSAGQEFFRLRRR